MFGAVDEEGLVLEELLNRKEIEIFISREDVVIKKKEAWYFLKNQKEIEKALKRTR
jgi:hypothetical protein